VLSFRLDTLIFVQHITDHRSGRERNAKDDLCESSSFTSLSSNTRTNQCISKVTGDDCRADVIIGTSEGTGDIPPMKTASESECDEHENLQKMNESVYLNFEEDVIPNFSTHGHSSLMKERLANLVSIGLSRKTKWGTKFEELQAFKNTYGHTNVLTKSGPLGRWVGTQRTEFRKAKLTDERIANLNGIDFQFLLRTLSPAAHWDTRFQELKAFKNAHGHTIVPTKSGPLGIWVSTQRRQFYLLNAGEKSTMSDERLAKLNGINFRFNIYSKSY
jgi:hypothetical protein